MCLLVTTSDHVKPIPRAQISKFNLDITQCGLEAASRQHLEHRNHMPAYMQKCTSGKDERQYSKLFWAYTGQCFSSEVGDSFCRKCVFWNGLPLRFVWLREERYVSPRISAAATVKRNPSAIAFAPLSIALEYRTNVERRNNGSSRYDVPCFR